MTSPELLEEQFGISHNSGVRLERVGGLTVWEAQPVYKHQAAIDRIRKGISTVTADTDGSGCGRVHISDVSILFPDGSEKRPDIAIYCREPDEEEQESAITLLPEAVIEVISKGYEAKDYTVGITFYLANGVKDIVTFDPRSNEVRHYMGNSLVTSTSPVTRELQC